MTATLWIDTDNEVTLELGGTIAFYKALAEMASAAGPAYLTDWPSLFALHRYVEDQNDAPEDYLTDLAREASAFSDKYATKLTDHPRWLLAQFMLLGSRRDV
jgi:hypothetical protein